MTLADHPRPGGGGGDPALTAADVARLVGSTVPEGADGARVVRRVAPLHRAAGDEVTFYANARYGDAFATTRAGVVLVAPELADAPGASDAVRLVVARPHEAMLAVLPQLYRAAERTPGIHPTALLGRGVRLGADATIGPYAVIGDGATVGDRAWIEAHCVVGAGVEIGADAHLFPHVTLYPGAVLGQRVTVHAGARLASDGFGYVFGDGAHRKIPHVGRCVVGDDVEIGANTTIDRGSVDDTIIGAGTKIDNLVQIGHNVRVGRLCVLVAQVGIAGSAVVEDGAVLGGQVGVGGHITVGRGSRVAGQGGVIGDLAPGGTYSGYPARPHREAMRASAAFFRLPALMRELEAIVAERLATRRAARALAEGAGE